MLNKCISSNWSKLFIVSNIHICYNECFIGCQLPTNYGTVSQSLQDPVSVDSNYHSLEGLGGTSMDTSNEPGPSTGRKRMREQQ